MGFKPNKFCMTTSATLEHLGKCDHLHIVPCPRRVSRRQRQSSVFTIGRFDDAVQPLEDFCKMENPRLLRRFPVPAKMKLELRRLLSELGLDSFSIYGDADSYGESLCHKLDFSGRRFGKVICENREKSVRFGTPRH
jgi:hypothetical protein